LKNKGISEFGVTNILSTHCRY